MWSSKLEPQLQFVRRVIIEGEEYLIAAIRVTPVQYQQVEELLTKPKTLSVNVAETVSSDTHLK